jgi:hypothetical protein
MQAYYDGDQRVDRIVSYDPATQVVENDFRIYRNGDAEIDSAYKYDGTQTLMGKYKMLYNLDGEIGRIDIFTDGDADGTFTLDEYYNVIYDNAGQIVEIRRFTDNDVQTAIYGFEWENGNVVNFDNNGPNLEFDYDNKLNLYTGLGHDVLFLTPQLLPLIMSKNNPVAVRQYNSLGVLDFSVELTHTYNEDNLPIQSTIVPSNDDPIVNQYEYTCD